METDETGAMTVWGQSEQTLLLLAREQEWAEAYNADHPSCLMGRLYLDFLRHEIISALGDL